jgi:subtilisin family serine protease
MRALIARIVTGRRRSARQTPRAGPAVLGWSGLLAALSLGVAASLAVAQGGNDQPADTQGTTGTDTQTTTASDTQTGTTETSSGSSGPRSGQGGSGSRYIVVYRDSVSDPQQKTDQLERDAGFSSDYKYSRAPKGFAARLAGNQLDRVRKDPAVQFVSPDRQVHALSQTLPTGIDRIDGDQSSTLSGNGSGGVGTAVAIIDTGSGPHSDLNLAGGKNCSTGTSYKDGNGHGTHVAGTVAAKDDGGGVVGVAPGASLYSIRVLNNSGSGTWSSVICGIDWVTANATTKNIKVANMSLGGGGSDDGSCGNSNSDALHKAICKSTAAGVTYVVAAGNSNTDFAGQVPAAYNEVLTVTALADFNGRPGGGAAASCRSDVDDTAADFSNYAVGSNDQNHTIAAPGVCIRSTWKGGGYNTISGTSMASPHVAGMAALCIASGKCTGTPADIMATLRGDAQKQQASYGFTNDPRTPNGNRFYGYLGYAGGY